MPIDIRIIAQSVPAICIVLGVLLIVTGNSGDNSLISSGWTLVIMGFVLQVLWLFTKRRGGD